MMTSVGRDFPPQPDMMNAPDSSATATVLAIVAPVLRHRRHDFLRRIRQVVRRLERRKLTLRAGEDLTRLLDVGPFQPHDDGTLKPICWPAVTSASAIRSHLAIPPKMLTRIPF